MRCNIYNCAKFDLNPLKAKNKSMKFIQKCVKHKKKGWHVIQFWYIIMLGPTRKVVICTGNSSTLNNTPGTKICFLQVYRLMRPSTVSTKLHNIVRLDIYTNQMRLGPIYSLRTNKSLCQVGTLGEDMNWLHNDFVFGEEPMRFSEVNWTCWMIYGKICS